MKTLQSVFHQAQDNNSKTTVSKDISPDRFKALLNALNAIQRQTQGDGWTLRLRGEPFTIEGPREPWVSPGIIRRTHRFLKKEGLTPDTVGDFLV